MLKQKYFQSGSWMNMKNNWQITQAVFFYLQHWSLTCHWQDLKGKIRLKCFSAHMWSLVPHLKTSFSDTYTMKKSWFERGNNVCVWNSQTQKIWTSKLKTYINKKKYFSSRCFKWFWCLTENMRCTRWQKSLSFKKKHWIMR